MAFEGCCAPKIDGSHDWPEFPADGGGGAVPDLGCGARCGKGTGSAMTGDAAAINPDNTNAINAAWLKPVMSCSAKRLPQIR